MNIDKKGWIIICSSIVAAIILIGLIIFGVNMYLNQKIRPGYEYLLKKNSVIVYNPENKNLDAVAKKLNNIVKGRIVLLYKDKNPVIDMKRFDMIYIGAAANGENIDKVTKNFIRSIPKKKTRVILPFLVRKNPQEGKAVFKIELNAHGNSVKNPLIYTGDGEPAFRVNTLMWMNKLEFTRLELMLMSKGKNKK